MPRESVMKYWKAINSALLEEMDRDPTVVIFGEDVGKAGGTFGETRGLQERFGADRVRDAPISELGIVGAGVGAAMAGLRPVVEILFIDFLALASDQIVNQAAKIGHFAGNAAQCPLVIKTGVGTEFGMGAQHSQSLEGWYAQIPGLTVCWPSTPRDAKALMKAAVRAEQPVIVLESLCLLRESGPVGDAEEVGRFGHASIVRGGSDATVVTYGTMVRTAVAAAGILETIGLGVEVIDLRTIVPWDKEMVFDSVKRTHRCVVASEAVREFGPSGEIASEVAAECFDALDAPVARVGSARVLAPQLATYDRWRVPQAAAIVDEVCRLVGVGSPC